MVEKRVVNLINPREIAKSLVMRFPNINYYNAFTCVVDGETPGFGIGMVEKNVKGYTHTAIGIDLPDYDDAEDVIEAVNKILFIRRTPEEETNLILSAM